MEAPLSSRLNIRRRDITCNWGTHNIPNDGTLNFQRNIRKNSRGRRGRSSVVRWGCIVAAVMRESLVGTVTRIPKVSAVQATQRAERPR